MNDYKRLTYKNDDGEWTIQFPQCTILDVFRCFIGANGEQYYTGTLVDKFADLEDKIESGELQFVERRTSKFKVGDIVWYKSLIPINPDGSLVPRFEPLEYRIYRVYYNQKGVTYKVKRPIKGARAYTIAEEYLFATKEEALARIKGDMK